MIDRNSSKELPYGIYQSLTIFHIVVVKKQKQELQQIYINKDIIPVTKLLLHSD